MKNFLLGFFWFMIASMADAQFRIADAGSNHHSWWVPSWSNFSMVIVFIIGAYAGSKHYLDWFLYPSSRRDKKEKDHEN